MNVMGNGSGVLGKLVFLPTLAVLTGVGVARATTVVPGGGPEGSDCYVTLEVNGSGA